MASASFSSLPPEIRQEIWLLSFEPRVLCLHMHQRIAPRQSDYDPHQLDYNSRIVLAVSFTCTALGSRSVQTPDDIFAERSKAIPQVPTTYIKEMHTKSPGPTSLGTVQLYVCRESRAVAMRRYELAFGGTIKKEFQRVKQNLDPRQKVALEDWESRKLWEKRIWVDFDNDIILMELVPRRRDMPVPAPTMTTLWSLNIYAREEVRKIRRLAIGGNWLHEGAIWREMGPVFAFVGTTPPKRGRNPNCIEAFKKLRELVVDDSFQIPKATAVIRVETMTAGQRIGNNAIGQREVVRDKVQSWIGSLNDRKPIWRQVPGVKVVRWDEWNMDNTLASTT
ncbi:uncharacterized protein PAC_12039 [Phialocephala subalpina]|uniref:2EXR domain-containing protein n=1 Tax=Phialocephala subalpina TaxID=576137 RepID=A0A1L7XAU3_9HELO|nr:uncharacterized protein PAC_12039 [Phialocephala subalpina]